MSDLKTSAGASRPAISPAISLLLKVGASAVLLYLVVSKINVSEAIVRITHVGAQPFFLALFLALTIPGVLALRWWVLARPVISLGGAFAFTWIGLFYGIILPGGVSGDIAKGSIMALRDASVRKAAFPASILADRIIGFTVMLFFFAASSLLISVESVSPALAHFALTAFAIGALGFIALLMGWTGIFQGFARATLARIPWAGGRVGFQQFAEATFAFSTQPRRLWSAAALSVCGQVLNVAFYLALLRSLSVHLGPVPTFALYSIFSVLAMAPISFAGIGVRDWFAIGFFGAYGLPAESAVAFAWLCLAMAVAQALIGGLWQLVIVAARPLPSPGRQ